MKKEWTEPEIEETEEKEDEKFDLISNGFRFGYIQGMKAARAEMRK